VRINGCPTHAAEPPSADHAAHPSSPCLSPYTTQQLDKFTAAFVKKKKRFTAPTLVPGAVAAPLPQVQSHATEPIAAPAPVADNTAAALSVQPQPQQEDSNHEKSTIASNLAHR